MSAAELVKSVSVENMVNQRDAVVEKLGQALALIADAAELAAAGPVGCPSLLLDCGRGRFGVTRDITPLLSAIDGPAWQYLLSESGLRTFMDATSRAKWDEQIRQGDVPLLTVANVEATFRLMYDARGDMFERGVIACFRHLSWDYKTNQPCKFGKRIILKRFVDTFGFMNHRATDELDDLTRVFSVLDGMPEPDHRSATFHRVSEAKRAGLDLFETDYFSVRWFKKGTAHLTFKRADLVEQLNRILAKHHPNALPARS